MKIRIKSGVVAVALAVGAMPVFPGVAQAASYAPWLTQLGLSDAIVSAGKWGTNQLLGVVDTGIVATHPAFASGQVSVALSACAAVSFTCPNGVVDDHNHGTAVAEIAAGNKPYAGTISYGGTVMPANSVVSMASNANIVAEKVLSATGVGYSADVASGVRKAVDAGASVINLSLGYSNQPDLVAAINYAAGKGAFIVWAGGNGARSLQGGGDTLGLSAAAISRMIFVGSVKPTNALSSFSNTPGAGSLVESSGKKTSYASRWVMAPGEGILAPVVTRGPTAWGAWTGTSMSAPLVSGTLLLLDGAWPILKTRGTAVSLLLVTTTDLGTAGLDTTYGNGLVSLARAFQPYGALMVTKADGSSVAVSSLTPSLISSGALGGMTATSSLLANYKAFDSYSRDFSVDLSGLIKTPATAARLNPLPTNTNTGPTVIKLIDGAELAYQQASTVNPAALLGVFDYNPEVPRDRRIGYAMLTDRHGTTTALGYGFPVQFSYARALYGNDDLARLSSQIGATSLAGLAQGGGLFAWGTRLGDDTRMAVSWSGTPVVADGGASWNSAWTQPRAANFSFGVSRQLSEHVTGGATLGVLDERHGVLGSTYDAGSVLSLGDSHRSTSLGLSGGIALSERRSLLLEAGFAWTGGGNAGGLFAGTSDIRARSWGVTYQERGIVRDADRLIAAVVQPLRVTSGQVAVVVPSVDADGIASFSRAWASLAPDGREIDIRLSYALPLHKYSTVSMQLLARKDAQNVAGNRDASAGVSWEYRF